METDPKIQRLCHLPLCQRDCGVAFKPGSVSVTLLEMSSCYSENLGNLFSLASLNSVACAKLFKLTLNNLNNLNKIK